MGILCDIDWINDIRHLLDAADPGTGCTGKVAALDVAVVIPTYNRAHLVGETLQSILSQTVTPHEIIVVDDGSQDETQAVLARFGQSIQCITIRNQGSVVARNVGLRAAGSRLVAFCDSDDLWREDFLERMLEVWHVEPRTRVAYCDFALVRGGCWEHRSKFAEAPRGFWCGMRTIAPHIGMFDSAIVDRVVGFQPFFASAIVADRLAFVAAGGWDEGVGRTVGDDLATALRCAELPPIGVVFRPLVGVRKHPGNFSGDIRAMNLGDSAVLEYVLETRPWLAPLRPAIEESINDRRRSAFRSAFADLDLSAAAAIANLLPKEALPIDIRVKRAISRMPAPLSRVAAKLATHLGTMRAAFRRMRQRRSAHR
jgi:hypothetical protein